MKPQRLTPAALALLLAAAGVATAQEPPSRSMDDLNWLEIRELVPARITTVLLTTGTLEPHGVINNGADNLAPAAIAAEIAGDINALIAPHIPYGITGSMSPYPGATYIPPEVWAPYVKAVMDGLARNGFRNIIVINGHGGPQAAMLQEVAKAVGLERGVNTLVVNWWTACSEAAVEVFGNRGGHAGENETAMIQAIAPALVHPELLAKVTATANPPQGAWSAFPAPSTITMYDPGTGTPTDFDQAKAEVYFRRVVACVRDLVTDILAKWEAAGF